MSEQVKARSEAEYEAILQLAVYCGHAFQMSGAETYRVEDSCQHLLAAYDLAEIEVFAIANYLSLSFRSPAGREYSTQKRLHGRVDNLRKIDCLNSKVRSICQEQPPAELALQELKAIMELPSYGLAKQVLITGLVGFAFTLLIGGSAAAAMFSFVVDVILRLVMQPLLKQQSNRVFVNILGGLCVTFLAWPSRYLGLSSELHLIIAGSFMYLFPGVSLMNSIRDIIASDYLAGMSKLLETLLVAVSIAIGAGIALAIINALAPGGI